MEPDPPLPPGAVLGTDGLPTTNVASLTGLVPPALTVATCRIVKMSHKYEQPNYTNQPERIVNPQGTFVVSLGYSTLYTYDKQGKLIQERDVGGAAYDYTYTADSIFYVYTLGDKKSHWASKINEKKLATTLFDSKEVSIEYNLNGYATRYYSDRTHARFTVENDNQTGERWYAQSGDTEYKTNFYLDRLNLPSIRTYWGRSSKNLPRYVIASVYNNPFYDDGPVSQVDYYYLYDRRGLVVRRIATIKPLLKRGTLFGKERTNIIDFEYACE